MPDTQKKNQNEKEGPQVPTTIVGRITDTLSNKILKKRGKNLTEAEAAEAREREMEFAYADKPFLKGIKPKRRYEFFSDYFKIDGKFCTIMTYVHPEGKDDKFGPFWGVSRIILPLPDGVTAIAFENIMRYTEGWVANHQSKTEGIVQMNTNENNANGGTSAAKLRNRQQAEELQIIAKEIQQGASYLGVTYRLLLKADSLQLLDKAVENIEQAYTDRFGTLSAGSYDACQREELGSLFKPPNKQRGKPFNFTSTEYAGSYSLITKGMDDKTGEYVGKMTDDVNNSAILFDVNKYGHHVVVANSLFDNTAIRNPISGYWCSKLAQSCLMHNGRVVHLIFDGTKLDELGPKFSGITRRLNLSKGDINMFEMFGDPDVDDEMSIFSEQLQKVSLMMEQLHPLTSDQRGMVLGVLKEILEKYYVDQRMWQKDAVRNKSLVRILGLDHNKYPKLDMFVAYIAMEHKKANAADVPDMQRVEALGILKVAFNEMLNTDGDLFNVFTNPEIDDVDRSARVIYDFSDLLLRGGGLAMAQFVNIVSYAVRSLRNGDLVVIHGVEHIVPEVKEYVGRQFEALYRRGGRICFAYDDIDRCFKDLEFNKFDAADYTIFGPFTANQVDEYQKLINQRIPGNLVKNLTKKGMTRTFVRRNGSNVLFNFDMVLGIPDMYTRFR